MHRSHVIIAGLMGLASLRALPLHAQVSEPPLAKPGDQTSLLPHRVGEPAAVADLKITLVSFGYAPKPLQGPSTPPEFRRTDPASKFQDEALHFVARLKLENTSTGRYIPVDNLRRLVSEPRDVGRSASDNWGNTITDMPWNDDTPHRPESLFANLYDPAAFKPGGPMTITGILPPGSTCELEVELEPPLFIGSSAYFLYAHPVLTSLTPVVVENATFFIPASQVVMPKEGQYIFNTPAYLERYDQIITEMGQGRRSDARSPTPAAGTADPSRRE